MVALLEVKDVGGTNVPVDLGEMTALHSLVRYLHEKSVLGLSLDRAADVVFSVGLVEHFDVQRTREAITAHFNVLRIGVGFTAPIISASVSLEALPLPLRRMSSAGVPMLQATY